MNKKQCPDIASNNVVRHLKVILNKPLYQVEIKRKCMRHLI